MNKKEIIKQSIAHYLERHRRKCKICNHPDRKEIEDEYLRCVPYVELSKRWKISYETFVTHGVKTGLWQRRDRKAFYWKLIEHAPIEKMTVENALEAAKQLDRLEGKLDHNAPPANIQVIYKFGKNAEPPTNTEDG